MRKVLFGTRNETRKEYVREILKDINVHIVSLNDLGIDIQIEENGISPLENSKIKAVEYYKKSGIPTFSIDAGLYIDKFPEEKQPGVFVRRIYGNTKKVTDEQMLNYYIEELKKCGGESKGIWRIGLTLVLSFNEIYSTTFDRETLFTTKVCNIASKGEPLNSIQINPKSGRYEAELTPSERKESQKDLSDHINKFMTKHLQKL